MMTTLKIASFSKNVEALQPLRLMIRLIDIPDEITGLLLYRQRELINTIISDDINIKGTSYTLLSKLHNHWIIAFNNAESYTLFKLRYA